MAEKRVSVRLAAVGGREIKNELRAVGREGREALDAIGTGAAPASGGLQSVNDRAGAAVTALENLSLRAGRAATSLRAMGSAGATAIAPGPMAARINQITGVTQATSQSTAAALRHGHALDELRAKYNPVFAAVQQYRQSLIGIRAAHVQGAISADEMTAAISRERQATLASIAALRGRTTAVQQMAAGTGIAAFRMQSLFYQVNDIGVSLASGQNPFTVMTQQGVQIAQIYGFGGGGVNGLMRDLGKMIARPIARFPLLTAAVVGTGVALAGMTREIRKATGVAVSLGDTMVAVFEVIVRNINDFLRPAIEAIAPWFAQTWDAVVDMTKDLGNSIAAIFAGTYEFIVALYKDLPNALSGFAKQSVNDALDDLRAPGLVIGGKVLIPGFPIPEDFGFDMSESENKALEAFNAAMDRDYMGEFFDSVSVEAVNNALERTAVSAEKVGAAAASAGDELDDSAEEAATGWAKTIETLRDYAAESMDMAGSLGDAIGGAFDGAANAVSEFVRTGKLSFKDMITSFIGDLARIATRRFITGPISSGLADIFEGTGGGFLSGLFGGFTSNEGGGYTGYGPRVGGLDGKGGFLTMVHPQERIVDEYRGGRGGGREAPVIVNIQTRDAESFRQSRTQVAADVGRAVAMGRRVM